MTNVRRRILLTLLVLYARLESAGQSPSSVADVARQATSSVVQVRTFDAGGRALRQGSGFVLRDGRIITNAHVVAGAASADILNFEGRQLLSTKSAIAISSESDLAVLGPVAVERGLDLARADVAVGEHIVVIGAPEGLTNTVSDGIVSAIRSSGAKPLVQISAPISPGSSGGPVLNLRGQVVGIAVGTIPDGQNLNFAVPVAAIRPLLVSRGAIPLQGIPSSASSQRSGQSHRDEGLCFGQFWLSSDSLPAGKLQGQAVFSPSATGRYMVGWFLRPDRPQATDINEIMRWFESPVTFRSPTELVTSMLGPMTGTPVDSTYVVLLPNEERGPLSPWGFLELTYAENNSAAFGSPTGVYRMVGASGTTKWSGIAVVVASSIIKPDPLRGPQAGSYIGRIRVDVSNSSDNLRFTAPVWLSHGDSILPTKFGLTPGDSVTITGRATAGQVSLRITRSLPSVVGFVRLWQLDGAKLRCRD
jgi:hypothetical protein